MVLLLLLFGKKVFPKQLQLNILEAVLLTTQHNVRLHKDTVCTTSPYLSRKQGHWVRTVRTEAAKETIFVSLLLVDKA